VAVVQRRPAAISPEQLSRTTDACGTGENGPLLAVCARCFHPTALKLWLCPYGAADVYNQLCVPLVRVYAMREDHVVLRARVCVQTQLCDSMPLFVYSFALHCCKVRHTALKCGTTQVTCSGEADRELAAAAAAAALGGVPTVVLGRDTDFCFYAGCS
jgi:hypothetical protein